MTRIPYADPATLSDAGRAALDSLPPLNVFRLMAHADPGFANFLTFTGGLWSDAELSPRRRELVILEVALLAHSPYEWDQHVPVARLCDITDAEIAALEARDHAAFDPGERALLEMTGVIVRRERSSDALLAATRAALSDRELIELHLLVAIYAGLAAAMTNLDLDLDDRHGADELTVDERGPRLGR
ncbi:unannotated protein [freshwater metagenome]|uniref:Unannotated protein n=1 Tax=freshwater metagenome TaxID=449393 RepID=A0A6J7J4X7_9ZZZZ|nr:hypothetical protein [Actinomycetota bacterium]